MTERTLVRRELTKQTALLFLVFAVLFALLGVGVFSVVSASVYRTADENLRAVGAEADLVEPDAVENTVPDQAYDEQPVARDEYDTLQGIVDADPQFITLVRNEQGAVQDTVGLYAAYPAYLSDVPFDPQDVDRIYEAQAGGHAYRGITYPLEGADGKPAYLQVLVNVDSELAILDGLARTLALYLAAAVLASAAASYLLSRRMLKPIVAAWRAQTEFAQNASHELRTPLAVIQTTGELLLDHPNSRIVDRFEDVSAITSETKRLARLVDDLMALSLDDAKRSTLAWAPVDVDALVRDAAGAYEDFAELQGKHLVVDSSFGGTVEADADKLRQLLGIVLDNALKYTAADDEIIVSTQADARSAGSKCVIAVADTGCGIDAADRAHVFERFYRADKARSRETGGYGLGLSLARSIVEAHGGTIELDANEPRGTVVTVILPITR